MKKYKNQFLLLLVVITVITSCKKDDNSTTQPVTGTVVGLWGGTGVTGGVTQKASFLFKSGNTLRFYNGASVASDTAGLTAANKIDGTYTVSSTNVTATYTYMSIPLLLAATANNSFTTMTGTAGQSPATTGIGTFTFTKQ